MKLLLVGEFIPFRIEFSYYSAFMSLGMNVLYFNLPIVSRFIRPFCEYIINLRLLRYTNEIQPDLILIFKGYYLKPETIMKIKKISKCLIFCFNPDDPFNIYFLGSSHNNILEAIPYYDCYFTFSRYLMERIKQKGAKKVEYLPFGFDPDIHYPVKVSDEERIKYAHDVAFIGNWSPEREDYLSELLEFDLGIWGEKYWRKLCKDKNLKKRWQKKAVYGVEQSKVLNSSKIALNILRAQNKGSHNMRTFELPACGVFVISEKSPEIEDFFKEDEEIVLFSSKPELKEKINYYLKNETKRKKISYRGFRRCIESDYTYKARAKKILEVFECLKNIKLL